MKNIITIFGSIVISCGLYAGIVFAGQQENFSDEKEPVLSKNQRISGLVNLWATVKYKYALWEYAEVDWDAILPKFLEKAEKAENNEKYYLVLEEMIALLKDNHTSLQKIPGRGNLRKPNVYIEPIEGQYVVAGFYSSNKRSESVRIGDIIVAVDGSNIEQEMGRVKPYIGASSEKELAYRSLDRILWRSKGKYVACKVKRQQKMFDVELPVTIPCQRAFNCIPRVFSHRLIENYYGYIRIPNFWDNKITRNFESAIEELKDTKALILDLRDNGGGNERYGAQVAGRLIQERMFFHRPTLESVSLDVVQEVIDSKMQDANELKLRFCISAAPSGPWQYDKPLVILVNWRTGSAAEGFTMGLQDCGRACIIGEKTLGSSGNPYYVDLPLGAQGRICVSKTIRVDGSRFHNIGIKPDIYVKKTVQGVIGGRDEVLEAAINYLRSLDKMAYRKQN